MTFPVGIATLLSMYISMIILPIQLVSYMSNNNIITITIITASLRDHSHHAQDLCIAADV